MVIIYNCVIVETIVFFFIGRRLCLAILEAFRLSDILLPILP